jgi:hypothetical protein
MANGRKNVCVVQRMGIFFPCFLGTVLQFSSDCEEGKMTLFLPIYKFLSYLWTAKFLPIYKGA